MMLQKIPRTPYLILGLIIALLTWHIYYLSSNYLVAGALGGVFVLAFALQNLFERLKPPDRFHILQPWRIPDPTSRGTLWLLAAFDALLYLPVYVAFAVSLAVVVHLAVVFIGLAVTTMLIGTMLGRYWRMRRQYETALNRGQEEGHGGHLSYVGPSDLNRNERWAIGVATAGLIAAWFLTPLLLVLWISRG